MKVLFLFPYPLGESPSQRFRFEQYLDRMKQKGIEVDTQAFWSQSAWKVLYQQGNYAIKFLSLCDGYCRRIGMLFRISRYDVVFIHREAAPLGPPIFEWMIARFFQKKLIYDFDDAIWIRNTSDQNNISAWLKWPGKVRSICRWSSRVSCGNEYLANFAKSYNAAVTINPTTIDTESMHIPYGASPNPLPKRITVGWTGTHSTLNYLTPLVAVLEGLVKSYPDVRILIIAERPPPWNFQGLVFKKWVKATEVQDLLEIDIGIMPLPDETWAKGKCGFKALQYMSLERPAVVSPVGVNTSIVDHGINGYHCTTINDWSKYLQKLIADPLACKEMGKQGRSKVVRHYSVAANVETFFSLFEWSLMSTNAKR